MTGKDCKAWLSRALLAALAGASMPVAGDVPESVNIPLTVVDTGKAGIKVGISVSVGGGAPQLYTFDTGSSGFYAAYNPAWWPSFTPLNEPPIQQTYGSGLTLEAAVVSTVVAIPTDRGVISVVADVGQVIGASGNADGAAWMSNVAAGIPPLYGTFFGDFGSGLDRAKGLFAVLPQLPGNLSSGFAVQLGCNGGGPESRVVVGLTDAIRSRVTSWVKMETGPNAPPYPNSNRPSFKQALVTGDYSLAQPGTAYAFTAPTILDTGGGTMSIHQAAPVTLPAALLNAKQDRVLPGVEFNLTAPGTAGSGDFDLAFVTGSTPTIDQVNVSTAAAGKAAEVNTGLVPFFRYDVVFDVERGNVGFAPCTPASPAAGLPVPALSAGNLAGLAAAIALIGALAMTRRRAIPRRDRR